MEFKEYVKAASLEEAWELNQKKPNRVAGGMLWLRLGKGSIGTVIGLEELGLGGIEETEDAFRIGAMTTLRELELNGAFNAYSQGAAADAVHHIIGTQFRNMATVGGSIAGRFGFSDVLTLFLAMDTEVELYRGGGKTALLSLEEYAAEGSGRDILTALIVKKTPADYFYQSVRISESDFPVLTTAARRLTDPGKTGPLWRFACGARPHRAKAAELPEGMLDRMISGNASSAESEKEIAKAAAWLKDRFPTGSNMRGSADYRTYLVGVLAERAVRKLTGEEGRSC